MDNMGKLAAVLYVLSLLLVCHAHSFHNARQVPSLDELVELQTKINYERIACEGEQFKGYSCSRYAMLNNDLVRKKLSYDASVALKREEFRSEVTRLFETDYHATLRVQQEAYNQLHEFLLVQQNFTLTLLYAESNATLRELYSAEYNNGVKDLQNVYNEARHGREFERSEEQHTRDFEAETARFDRAFDTKEEITTRYNNNHDANTSRTTIAVESQATRNHDSWEEHTTTGFALAQQNQTRALVASEGAAVRAEEYAQQQRTLAAWRADAELARQAVTSDSTNNKQNTTTIVVDEQTITRNLVIATETDHVNSANQQQSLNEAVLGAKHENQSSVTSNSFASSAAVTSANSSAAASATQQTINSAASNVQATWTPAAANILGLLTGFQSGIPSPLFNTLSIHLNLIQSYHKGPSAELYSRANNFNQLRSVVNATISYNNQKYGSSGLNAVNAANYWSTGESYRTQSNPDYRRAVESYSSAYYYAITPTNANSN